MLLTFLHSARLHEKAESARTPWGATCEETRVFERVMTLQPRKQALLVAVALTVVAVLVVGVQRAMADPPNNTYCVNKFTGAVHVSKDGSCVLPSLFYPITIGGGSGGSGGVGPSGASGAQGPSGTSGASGPEGPSGPSGASGPEGPSGASGASGASGPQGVLN